MADVLKYLFKLEKIKQKKADKKSVIGRFLLGKIQKAQTEPNLRKIKF